MTDITIPPEALEAAANAIFDAAPFREQAGELHDQSELYQALTRAYARAAFLAIVENWPGNHIHEWQRPWLGGVRGTDLILPLTEKSND